MRLVFSKTVNNVAETDLPVSSIFQYTLIIQTMK